MKYLTPFLVVVFLVGVVDDLGASDVDIKPMVASIALGVVGSAAAILLISKANKPRSHPLNKNNTPQQNTGFFQNILSGYEPADSNNCLIHAIAPGASNKDIRDFRYYIASKGLAEVGTMLEAKKEIIEEIRKKWHVSNRVLFHGDPNVYKNGMVEINQGCTVCENNLDDIHVKNSQNCHFSRMKDAPDMNENALVIVQ